MPGVSNVLGALCQRSRRPEAVPDVPGSLRRSWRSRRSRFAWRSWARNPPLKMKKCWTKISDMLGEAEFQTGLLAPYSSSRVGRILAIWFFEEPICAVDRRPRNNSHSTCADGERRGDRESRPRRESKSQAILQASWGWKFEYLTKHFSSS